ncbi:MAG: hypothetical protein IBX69_16135 [Anaerolineales bacterium]|nr:hypothetical protein [Anaerolineales bacterium]
MVDQTHNKKPAINKQPSLLQGLGAKLTSFSPARPIHAKAAFGVLSKDYHGLWMV